MPSWTHSVFLDSADITAETSLSGLLIEEAENESALCDVDWRPPGGQQLGLILQTLEVIVDLAGPVTMFSGKVIRATWDEHSQQYRLRASNRLQEHFRALGDEAGVESELAPAGVSPSQDFFGDPPDDLWEYAEQLLETTPYECHLDRAGTLQLVPWEAGTPDHTLLAVDIDGTQGPDWVEADADAKTNQVLLDVDIGFSRWKVREHEVSWSLLSEPQTATFCDWVQGANGAYWPPPTLEEVQSPLDGGSWNVPGGLTTEQVPFGVAVCGLGQPLDWQFDKSSYPLTAVSAHGFRGLSCGIQEKYRLELNAVEAQTYYGETVSLRRQTAVQIDPEGDWPPASVDQDSLTSPSTDTAGDSYEDQLDETRRSDLLGTAYAWGRTTLLSAQRQDSRRITTLFNPSITLSDTVRANVYGFDTTGKVRRLRHTLSPFRTEVTIALSRGGGTDTPYSTPARPDSSDPVGYWEAINGPGTYPVPSPSHSVPTYIGSRTTSPDKATFAPDEEGYFSNAVNYPGFGGEPEKIYDRVFRVHWPSQEKEATGDIELYSTTVFDIATPADVT